MSIWTLFEIFMYVAFIGALILTATKWLAIFTVAWWAAYGLWYAAVRFDIWRRT